MTQPESRTVEERLAAAEILARVRFEREHRMKWEDVRGGTGEHLAASYLSDAHADLAAAKEHGLVIGEGELDAAWKEAEAALPEGWQMGSLLATVGFDGGIASTVRWRATAYSIYGGYGRDEKENDDATGSTPAAALHALAGRLRR